MGSPSCSAMYSSTIWSVMVPELTARYPRAQTCLPHNCFLRCGNSWRSTLELVPFSHCTILLTCWWGWYDMNTWIWSCDTLPDRICISCSIAIWRIKSRTRMATAPISILLRYLGIHTRWTLRSCFVCAPIRYRFTRPYYTKFSFASRRGVSTIPEGDTKNAMNHIDRIDWALAQQRQAYREVIGYSP